MYEHIWSGKELTQRFYGHTSVEEIMQSVIEVEQDPRFQKITDVYDDFIDCESICLQGDLFEKTIVKIAENDFYAWIGHPKVKAAVIGDQPEVIKIVDAYIKAETSHYPVKLFSNYEEARQWMAEDR